MEPWTRIAALARYRLTADSPHGIHSPFIFDFLNDIVLDRTPFYAFGPLHSLRAKLSLDQREISVTDLGAGGRNRPDRKRTVREIARKSLLPEKYARILFRSVNHFRPKSILELGTSLGISTLHLALPDPSAKVITVEGCPETAAIAQENFRRLSAANIRLMTGEFSEILPSILSRTEQLDFIYLDGNHRLAPTLSYFEQVLPKCHEGTVMVVDDIHWSREMEEAWKTIRQDTHVTLTADLFRMGFVFFRQGTVKQHFTLKS